jgi:hypothetical protein
LKTFDLKIGPGTFKVQNFEVVLKNRPLDKPELGVRELAADRWRTTGPAVHGFHGFFPAFVRNRPSTRGQEQKYFDA